MRRVLLRRVKRPKDKDYSEMIIKIGRNAFLTNSHKSAIQIIPACDLLEQQDDTAKSEKNKMP